MFSALACGQQDFHGQDDGKADRSISFAQDDHMDGEFFDKLLSEGIRLKKKCKSLKTMMCELEELRENDRLKYEYNIQSLNKKWEISISDIKSQQYLDMAAIVDSSKQEAELLSKSLQEANSMNAKLDEDLVELRQRITELVEENKRITVEYERNLAALENQSEAEKKNIIMQRMEHEDGIRVTLLRRALLAEDEVARLKKTCADLEATAVEKEELSRSSELKNAFVAVQRNQFEVENELQGKVAKYQSEVEKLKSIIEEKSDLIKEKNDLLSEKDSKINELKAASKSNTNINASLVNSSNNNYERRDKDSDSHIRLVEINDLLPLQASVAQICGSCKVLKEQLRETSSSLKDSQQQVVTMQQRISNIMSSKESVVLAVNELIEENQSLKDTISSNAQLQSYIQGSASHSASGYSNSPSNSPINGSNAYLPHHPNQIKCQALKTIIASTNENQQQLPNYGISISSRSNRDYPSPRSNDNSRQNSGIFGIHNSN